MPVASDASFAVRARTIERLLARPPVAVRRQVDAINPCREAMVFAGSFTACQRFCGRKVIGGRTREHFESERKDKQPGYLPEKPPRFVDLSDVEKASATLGSSARSGSIFVSGIPRHGLAAGASHTYLVDRGASDLARSVARSLSLECRTAVVRKRDRGIPCPYYGFVTPKWAVAFGPFEALVCWNRLTGRVAAPGIVGPIALPACAREYCQSKRPRNREAFV